MLRLRYCFHEWRESSPTSRNEVFQLAWRGRDTYECVKCGKRVCSRGRPFEFVRPG